MGGDPTGVLDHERYDLCEPCHTGPDGIHAKRWTFTVDENRWVEGVNANGTTFSHPLVIDNDSPSPAAWDDAKLGLYWEKAGAALMEDRATIANIYQQRWGWGQGWAKRAADAMGGGKDGTGLQISTRSVRRAANQWALWKGNWETMKRLGSLTVAYAIASADDAPAALVIAEKELADGKKAHEVVRLIEGKPAKVDQTEQCVCGQGEGCGHVHTRKEG
jgi:hypothetical protein